MKILYDMSTGEILEAPRQVKKQTEIPFQETHLLPELRLQEATASCREAQRIPAELAILEIDDFLKGIS